MTSIASMCGWRRVIRALAALLCLACAGLVAQAQAAGAVASESYRVQATDILVIEVVNEPQLAGKEFRVSSNGEISYPYIGDIKAAGRTTVEIQQELKRLLESDYLVSAQVIVQVREFRKQEVAVFGEVAKPGLIIIPPERRLTVIEAITAAGGLTRLARTSGIELTRPGRTEPMVFKIEDLRDPEKAVYVLPGDMIFVPQSRI